MSAENTVTFYLHPTLRKQAERGNHNFVKNVSDVLTSSGLEIAFDTDDDLGRLRAMARPGRGLFLMDEPVNARSLVFRKTYIYPFWHIEKQAKRWEWPIAQEVFDPTRKDPKKADNFYRFWQNRLFDGSTQEVGRDGFVYVPLQGRLTSQRSFQFCSPIDMIKAVLEYDRDRYVMVTLHPSEVYSVEEQHALEELIAENERLYVRMGATGRYLQNCDYIVTQNSSVGFMGYFFGKPLILFGKTDFHHIALNVDKLGVAEAFAAVSDHQPDYAAYLHWFLQLRAINAGRPEVKTKIRTVLRSHGWPV
jgi:hypothetical protein